MYQQRTTCRSTTTTTTTLLLLLSSSLAATAVSLSPHGPAAGRQDSRDEFLSRWSAAGRQGSRDELLSHRAAAGRQDPRDRHLSRLIDTYIRGTSTAAAVETTYRDAIETPYRDALPSVVTMARNGRLDGTPCPTVEGLWLSTNLETAFDMRATGMAGRLDVRAVGSDWTGGAESLFVDRGGPLIAIVSQRDTSTAVTFVGHCRASDGVDTMTGVWVIASPAKNKLDHHLAVQPVPDTLRRLKVE